LALWGRSVPMRRVYQQIVCVASTAVTTSSPARAAPAKEVAARTHDSGAGAAKNNFLAVNRRAISPGNPRRERDLFGHEKGSFTALTDSNSGLFRAHHQWRARCCSHRSL
jgi:DNA-binding NtrC family response regulator